MDRQQIFNHLKSCFAYLFKSASVCSAFLSQQISTNYRLKPAGHVSKYVLVRKYTIYKLLESYESEEFWFVWCLARILWIKTLRCHWLVCTNHGFSVRRKAPTTNTSHSACRNWGTSLVNLLLYYNNNIIYIGSRLHSLPPTDTLISTLSFA